MSMTMPRRQQRRPNGLLGMVPVDGSPFGSQVNTGLLSYPGDIGAPSSTGYFGNVASAQSPIEGILSLFGVDTAASRRQNESMMQDFMLRQALLGTPSKPFTNPDPAAPDPNLKSIVDPTKSYFDGAQPVPQGVSTPPSNQGLLAGAPESVRTLATIYPQLVAQSILSQQFAGPKEPVALSEGSTLVDPATGKVIAQGAPKDKRTDLERNFEAAKSQGFTGNIFDYQRALAEAGRAPGQPRQVQTVTTAEGVFVLNPDGTRGIRIGDVPGRNGTLSEPELRQQFESEGLVAGADATIKSLNRALELNAKAASGPFAEWVEQPANRVFNKEAATATTEFNTNVLEQALSSMKQMFGANPTEGEREMLLRIQAAPTMTRPEREALLRRALEMAQTRKAFEADRINRIRSGAASRRTDATGAPAPSAPAPTAAPPTSTNPAQMSDEELIRRVLGGK